MKKAKKVLALVLVFALTIAGTIGATVAYLTDKDYKQNVMTIGNIAIQQNEKDRYGNDFEQNQKLYPMVDNREEGEETVVDGYFNNDLANVIDKIVTVTNTGSETAYIRTILAFETIIQYEEGTNNEINLHDVYFGVNGDFDYLYNEDGTAMIIEIKGVQYWLAEKVYEAPVDPGNSTTPSLKQFFLAPTADNEVSELFGEEYNILSVSQGVQIEGFADAETALNRAFGEVTEENALVWFTTTAEK